MINYSVHIELTSQKVIKFFFYDKSERTICLYLFYYLNFFSIRFLIILIFRRIFTFKVKYSNTDNLTNTNAFEGNIQINESN